MPYEVGLLYRVTGNVSGKVFSNNLAICVKETGVFYFCGRSDLNIYSNYVGFIESSALSLSYRGLEAVRGCYNTSNANNSRVTDITTLTSAEVFWLSTICQNDAVYLDTIAGAKITVLTSEQRRDAERKRNLRRDIFCSVEASQNEDRSYHA